MALRKLVKAKTTSAHDKLKAVELLLEFERLGYDVTGPGRPPTAQATTPESPFADLLDKENE